MTSPLEKKLKIAGPVLITANRLADGAVIYRTADGGWTTEFERPIYFLEHRGGFICGWCTVNGNQLVLQPHPASMCFPEVFLYPEDIEIIGQVTGVAMRLDQGKRRRARP